MDTPETATCTSCGRTVPRDDMFGAAPDLLCERCADRVRERLTPKATGRMLTAIPQKAAPVTLAVIGAAAIVFLVGGLLTDNPKSWVAYLVMNGNVEFPDGRVVLTGGVQTGQVWRFATSALVHLGVLHILFNSMWIWVLGSAVEGTRGSAVTAGLMLASALGSGALAWMGDGAAAGLSGVVYALAAYLWARRRVDAVAASIMNPGTTRMLVAWMLVCMFLPSLRIANWGHASGALWGLLAGWASVSRRPLLGNAALLAATAALVAIASGQAPGSLDLW